MASSVQIPTAPLADGGSIPQFGLGVFQVPPAEAEENVLRAIELGYRHIDTAAAYENEAEVGRALRASGVDRSEIFVTTKCWNDRQGRRQALDALRASLDLLETDHVDLY